MKLTDVRWNEEARAKVLQDADDVLQNAVASLASTMKGDDSDAIFAALNQQLKDKFIDYAPGPDIRKYADAISAGEIEI